MYTVHAHVSTGLTTFNLLPKAPYVYVSVLLYLYTQCTCTVYIRISSITKGTLAHIASVRTAECIVSTALRALINCCGCEHTYIDNIVHSFEYAYFYVQSCETLCACQYTDVCWKYMYVIGQWMTY